MTMSLSAIGITITIRLRLAVTVTLIVNHYDFHKFQFVSSNNHSYCWRHLQSFIESGRDFSTLLSVWGKRL